MSKEISRRDFIKATGLVVVGTAFAACVGPDASPTESPAPTGTLPPSEKTVVTVTPDLPTVTLEPTVTATTAVTEIPKACGLEAQAQLDYLVKNGLEGSNSFPLISKELSEAAMGPVIDEIKTNIGVAVQNFSGSEASQIVLPGFMGPEWVTDLTDKGWTNVSLQENAETVIPDGSICFKAVIFENGGYSIFAMKKDPVKGDMLLWPVVKADKTKDVPVGNIVGDFYRGEYELWELPKQKLFEGDWKIIKVDGCMPTAAIVTTESKVLAILNPAEAIMKVVEGQTEVQFNPNGDFWLKAKGIVESTSTPIPPAETLLESLLPEISPEEQTMVKTKLNSRSIYKWSDGKVLEKYKNKPSSWMITMVSGEGFLDLVDKPLKVPISDTEKLNILVAVRSFYLDEQGQVQSVILPIVSEFPDGTIYYHGGPMRNACMNWTPDQVLEKAIEIGNRTSGFVNGIEGRFMSVEIVPNDQQLWENWQIDPNSTAESATCFNSKSLIPDLTYLAQRAVIPFQKFHQEAFSLFFKTGKPMGIIIPFQLPATFF